MNNIFSVFYSMQSYVDIGKKKNQTNPQYQICRMAKIVRVAATQYRTPKPNHLLLNNKVSYFIRSVSSTKFLSAK